MHMLPSTIKKSVMTMQLSDFSDGSMPMEEASSNRTCIILCFGLYKNIYFYHYSSPNDRRNNCPLVNSNKIITEMF